MMKRNFFILVSCLFLGAPLHAIDGVYLGGHLGHIGLTGSAQNYSNAIGLGLDVGVKTGDLLDVVFRLTYSSHSGQGGLTLYHPTVSADFHFFDMNDFDLTIGAGPGVYFFGQGANTESDFGLNFGVGVDAIVDEGLRLGLGWRWHSVFDGQVGDHFWSIMIRVGYLFEM